jgi:hypothetical protein
MKQVSTMVQKIRKDATKDASLIWDSPSEMSTIDQGVEDSADYKQMSSTIGHGMVISGSVVEVGCCRNCKEFEIDI